MDFLHFSIMYQTVGDVKQVVIYMQTGQLKQSQGGFSVHRHITLRDQLPVATASNHLPTGWGIHIQKATPMKNI